MKNVVLIFPDTVRMAHFVITGKISNAEVNTRELALSCIISDSQLHLACAVYNAYPKYCTMVA